MFLEMYVRKFVDDEYEAQKLMELIEMKKDLYHRTVDTIFSRGEAKGRSIAEARIINNLLENGFTLDEICAMVNLEKNYVLNLLK
jgi:Fe-S cluster assembly ATPase SufC